RLPTFRHTSVATIDLIRYNPEHGNLMAYLLMKMIEELSLKGRFKYFDLGFVPFAKAKGPLLKIAAAVSAGRFSAKGLEQFKNKFKPDWQPVFLAYDGDWGD